MIDALIKTDMDEKIRQAEDIVSWLERLYYNRTVINVFAQPALSMIITGAKFLRDNLKHIRDNYINQ